MEFWHAPALSVERETKKAVSYPGKHFRLALSGGQIGSVHAPVTSRQREADYEACACPRSAVSFYRSAMCIDDPF